MVAKCRRIACRCHIALVMLGINRTPLVIRCDPAGTGSLVRQGLNPTSFSASSPVKPSRRDNTAPIESFCVDTNRPIPRFKPWWYRLIHYPSHGPFRYASHQAPRCHKRIRRILRPPRLGPDHGVTIAGRHGNFIGQLTRKEMRNNRARRPPQTVMAPQAMKGNASFDISNSTSTIFRNKLRACGPATAYCAHDSVVEISCTSRSGHKICRANSI